MTGEGIFLHYCAQAAMFFLLAGMALTLWRLIRGPSAADRVIAMDLLSLLVVAFLVALSLHTGESTYLDVAIAYACIAFLGTIALARFVEKSVSGRGRAPSGRDADV